MGKDRTGFILFVPSGPELHPRPRTGRDREDTQGEASRGSGEDPGLAQETVLTVGEGEGRNSHRLKG